LLEFLQYFMFCEGGFFMELGLKDKVVVCLSSAAGIGKGIAAEAAREGAQAVICNAEAYKEDLLTAQAEIEKETGNRPYTVFYDVRDAASIKKLIDDVAVSAGRRSSAMAR